jgi:hypothetical protein
MPTITEQQAYRDAAEALGRNPTADARTITEALLRIDHPALRSELQNANDPAEARP